MQEIEKVYCKRQIVAAKLDLGDLQDTWINPRVTGSNEFKMMVDARALVNNGCSEKQKRFFMKLARMISWDLGWESPEALLREIDFFKKDFSVWG